METLIALVILIGIGLLVFRFAKQAPRSRHRGSATVELTVNADGVDRVLADGRSESIAWRRLAWVEVVNTPVKTADGATSFLLLAESDSAGVLVPIGVGHDEQVLVELSRLKGFDLAALSAELDKSAPYRERFWEKLG